MVTKTTATSTDVTWKEMMAIFFARQIKDGDTLCSGAHTEISFSAAMLAQRMHAPNLRLQLGGTGWLCNLVGQEVWGVPKTSVDYRISNWAEGYFDHPETFIFYGPPSGGREYYENLEKYADVNRYFFADHFFVGGIQVDYHGNVNLIGLSDGNGGMAFRGPGTVGINDVITVRNMFVFMTAHDERRFVEKVDYISTLGPAGWREKQFPGNGPQWIVSPRGVFDFTGEGMTARLRGVFPGHTEEEIVENTGFPVERSEYFEEIEPPTEEELRRLREEVDREGVLRS